MKNAIGSIIKVEIPKFNKGFFICRILRDDVKNDSFGTIELQIIQDSQRIDSIYYEPNERNIVVEENWFNEELTGRKVTKLSYYANYVERKNPKDEFEKHLKYLILVDGLQLSEHSELETAKIHVDKINKTQGRSVNINIPKW